ncbi:MAG: hypothetical protein IT204_05490 [Fimbriimonadaceae bacterium]|nr:hypothetical protein [Fimbriimonadaceae bacterium]
MDWQWFPANYSGFGVVDSRVYLTPVGQVLAVLAVDCDAKKADPIVMACGLRPSGNGGRCWCVAPLLTRQQPEAPFPNACFDNVDEVEEYLDIWATDLLLPLPEEAPIDHHEVATFAQFLEHHFEPPRV